MRLRGYIAKRTRKGTSDQAELQRLSTFHGRFIDMRNTQRDVSITLGDYTSAQLYSWSLERVDGICPDIPKFAPAGNRCPAEPAGRTNDPAERQ